MFERIEAVRFDRKMSVGRTKPLLLVGELDEAEVEVVGKFSRGCSVEGLVREAVSAMFGSDLGLPVPAPYLIQLTDTFIDTIPDTDVATMLRQSDRFGFGSQRLPPSFGGWVNPGGNMPAPQEQEALEILAFDCWSTNADRRIANPNLLTDGNRFAIFDHELALMTDLNLFWKAPWIVNALEDAQPPNEHIFFAHLRGRKNYATNALQARLGALSDDRIAAYFTALPASWCSDATAIASMRSFIMSLRDNLVLADGELKRALS